LLNGSGRSAKGLNNYQSNHYGNKKYCRGFVHEAIADEPDRKFIEFQRFHIEVGITKDESDDYSPTRRTLRQFSKATEEMSALVRDVIIPNPDV
jgi:hypothetical protein